MHCALVDLWEWRITNKLNANAIVHKILYANKNIKSR